VPVPSISVVSTIEMRLSTQEDVMLRRRLVPISAWILAIAIASVAGLSAQATNALSGTWKLNVAKSKYSPATLAPKSGTTKFTVSNDTIRAMIDGVDSQGRATHSEYTAKFDGKDYPWKGTIAGSPNPDQDAVAWRKIDANTYETVNKLKGQTLTTSRIVVAADGKSRTNTATGKNAQGQVMANTAVYEKQ
jgi:hypothetical protein